VSVGLVARIDAESKRPLAVFGGFGRFEHIRLRAYI
jgi:hypothetical protein